MGAGGVGSQFPSKKPQGPQQAPRSQGLGSGSPHSFEALVLPHSGPPLREGKGPGDTPPQLREWSRQVSQ